MAKSPQLRCPKCSGRSTSRVECSHCGLIFARYTMSQSRIRAAKKANVERDNRLKRISSLALNVFIIAVIMGAVFYFIGGQKPETRVAQTTPQASQSQAVTQNPQKATPPSNIQTTTTPAATAATTTKAATSRKNAFEIAKQSIVTIETPWGRTGFGSFIEEDKVITSKSLVEFNEERQEKYIETIEQTRKYIEQETRDIEELESEYNQMAEGPGKTESADEIDARKKRLSDTSLTQQNRKERLANKSNSDLTDSTLPIKLYSSDGSELQVSSTQSSNTHDLALLYVYDSNVPFIERPPEDVSLKEGDTVYSLGAEGKGIAGTFTQYNQGDSPANNYLQTDTPISLEYSGSPLIDKNGYIHGVSTTSLTNEDGIGAAIPLDIVLSEFLF